MTYTDSGAEVNRQFTETVASANEVSVSSVRQTIKQKHILEPPIEWQPSDINKLAFTKATETTQSAERLDDTNEFASSDVMRMI